MNLQELEEVLGIPKDVQLLKEINDLTLIINQNFTLLENLEANKVNTIELQDLNDRLINLRNYTIEQYLLKEE